MKNFSGRLVSVCTLLAFMVLSLPVQALSKQESEKAGAVLFRDKGCAYCHGPAAQGTQKGPSLANVRKTLKAPQIAHQIQNGGKQMPAFKSAVSPDELAQLISFLRAKHRPIPPPPPVYAPLSNPEQ
jgi:mono/diheme cytochrome c family protein